MSETIVVTVLVENSVRGRGLRAEHGLALHVQAGSDSLLFDTGQSDLVVENARQLGVDLSRLCAVVLSHGHYDHAGGLRAVRELAPRARLYAHPAAFVPRFARHPDKTTRAVGIDEPGLDAIRVHGSPLQGTPGATEVLKRFFLTGEIPRETDFEDVGGAFVLDEAGVRPDPIADDQALFFDTWEGLVVLLGCAHAGLVNTLRRVRQLAPDRPIHAVLGGMHLGEASPGRMEHTVEALRELGVSCLGPAHCTGAAATARLWHEFPRACVVCSVGSSFVFHRQPAALELKQAFRPEARASRSCSRLDRALASVCRNCPVCRRARKRPDGPAGWLVHRVEHQFCPFCRAYERVYGRKAHENREATRVPDPQ
jgi:7,8-dihydropterin-6-yl-methyl-4-(beta-D-ribofuranosyl)aminobenzene 5'-phosphate synthase